MILAERLATDMVIFTDIDSDIGFSTNMRRESFPRLAGQLGLSEEDCDDLYWEMCQYRKIYIMEGQLFRQKRNRVTPHTYYRIPRTKEGTENQLADAMADAVEKADDLYTMMSGDTSEKIEISGIRHDR